MNRRLLLKSLSQSLGCCFLLPTISNSAEIYTEEHIEETLFNRILNSTKIKKTIIGTITNFNINADFLIKNEEILIKFCKFTLIGENGNITFDIKYITHNDVIALHSDPAEFINIIPENLDYYMYGDNYFPYKNYDVGIISFIKKEI